MAVKDWKPRFPGANFKKWRLVIFLVVVSFSFKLSFSGFLLIKSFRYRSKDVFDSERCFRCPSTDAKESGVFDLVWMHLASPKLMQHLSFAIYLNVLRSKRVSCSFYLVEFFIILQNYFLIALNCWRILTQRNVITSFVGKLRCVYM